MKRTSLPTSEKLLAFAQECNEFLRQNPTKKSINDFTLWACGKLNPYWTKGDYRTRLCGAGVKPFYKAILKLFTPGATGRFPMEHRFTEDLYVEVSVDELIRMTGMDLSHRQWDYARNKLVATGVLETITRKFKDVNYYSRMWVKINFARLREVLGRMHILRMETPKSNGKPVKSAGDSQGHSQVVSRSSKLASGSSCPGLDSSIPAPASSGASGSDRELSAKAEVSVSDPEGTPFGERLFQGQPESEIACIIRTLKDLFPNTKVTNDRVRKIQNLNNRDGDRQMTPLRAQKFVELASSTGFLPDWMCELDFDLLLTPQIWSTVAKEINRSDFSDAREAQEELDSIDSYQKDIAKVQVLLASQEAFDEWVQESYDSHQPPWMLWLLHGFQHNWVGKAFDLIREKAKKMLLRMPLWFIKTDPTLHWSKALGLSDDEIEQIRQSADRQGRDLGWDAYMGRVNRVEMA
jgi:hypothetical protein